MAIWRSMSATACRSKARSPIKGDGKLKVETKTKTKVDGDDKETKSKSEVKGDMAGARFLGVKSMKMIAASCP